MSQARAFVDRVRHDPALAERVQAIAAGDAALDRLVALGGEHGFSFDGDQLAATLRPGAEGEELTEDDLEHVQGGIIAVLIGLVQDSRSDGTSLPKVPPVYLCPSDD